MKVAASFYTFLIFNFRFCFSNMNNDRMQAIAHAQKNTNCTNCRDVQSVQRDIESIKQMEIIKLEIMRRLNISAQNEAAVEKEKETTVPKPEPKVSKSDYEYRGADILRSYSEPPDNFTDENIIQFRLGDMTAARRKIFVNSANLLVRVKYKRRKNRHKDKFRSKRNILKINGTRTVKKTLKPKAVDLKLFTVNPDGKPAKVITSVTSTLKKTKWLKLSLPRNIVQSAIDSRKDTIQVYITCRGCGKRAHIILVHKGRKRKRNKPKKRNRRKLHKRRPMLITRITKVEMENRNNTSAETNPSQRGLTDQKREV